MPSVECCQEPVPMSWALRALRARNARVRHDSQCPTRNIYYKLVRESSSWANIVGNARLSEPWFPSSPVSSELL